MRKLLALPLILFTTSCLSIGVNESNSKNPSLNHDQPYGYMIDTNIARKGKESQRFEVRHGDCDGDRKWNDCKNDRRRYERYVDPVSSEKPGGIVWYAYSMFFPKDFPRIYPVNTTLGQVKLHDTGYPIWYLSARRKGIHIRYDASFQECKLVKYEEFLGKWTDFLIKVDYSTKEEHGKSYSDVYVNGKLIDCEINSPVLEQEFINERRDLSKPPVINFRYGIYNTFASRWLSENKTKDVSNYPRSLVKNVWKVDWGVELPTQVIHYDEVRIGPTRESVDIELNDPVD